MSACLLFCSLITIVFQCKNNVSKTNSPFLVDDFIVCKPVHNTDTLYYSICSLLLPYKLEIQIHTNRSIY